MVSWERSSFLRTAAADDDEVGGGCWLFAAAFFLTLDVADLAAAATVVVDVAQHPIGEPHHRGRIVKLHPDVG